MSYVPAKLREIFQTCRLRPENIADRGRFRLGDRKSGHPFRPCRPERGAGDATAAGRFAGGGLPFRPVSAASPFRGKFRSHFLFGERAGEDRGAGVQGVRRPPRWTITMDRGLFSIEKAAARSRSVPLPVHPLRMSANVGNRRVCAAADRAAFPGKRADLRMQRRRDGFERCRQPGRVRTRAFSCGSAQRFRLIGKGRAGTVRRVADDADGSFTNGSNRESPATGPASGRGTGWG